VLVRDRLHVLIHEGLRHHRVERVDLVSLLRCEGCWSRNTDECDLDRRVTVESHQPLDVSPVGVWIIVTVVDACLYINNLERVRHRSSKFSSALLACDSFAPGRQWTSHPFGIEENHLTLESPIIRTLVSSAGAIFQSSLSAVVYTNTPSVVRIACEAGRS